MVNVNFQFYSRSSDFTVIDDLTVELCPFNSIVDLHEELTEPWVELAYAIAFNSIVDLHATRRERWLGISISLSIL